LLGLDRKAAHENHPELGASWEDHALEQLPAFTGEREPSMPRAPAP